MDEGDCPCAVQPSSSVAKQMHVFLKALYSQTTLHRTRLAESFFFGGVAAMLNLSRCAILIFIPQ